MATALSLTVFCVEFCDVFFEGMTVLKILRSNEKSTKNRQPAKKHKQASTKRRDTMEAFLDSTHAIQLSFFLEHVSVITNDARMLTVIMLLFFSHIIGHVKRV